VKSTLNKLGWSPATGDLLNHSQATSHQIGWTNFVRGKDRIFQWRGWWQDAKGNAVLYQLEFTGRGEDATSALAPLAVNAVYIDARTLEMMRSQAKDIR
jgi:hypothetical protein